MPDAAVTASSVRLLRKSGYTDTKIPIQKQLQSYHFWTKFEGGKTIMQFRKIPGPEIEVNYSYYCQLDNDQKEG